jgi:hypothetical protein
MIVPHGRSHDQTGAPAIAHHVVTLTQAQHAIVTDWTTALTTLHIQ